MTLLLALDPGRSTGWSVWEYGDTKPLTHLEHGTIAGGLEGFIDFAMGKHGYDEVVAETFRLDGRTVKPDVTPLRIEGALTTLFPGWVGQPNSHKVHAPDALLKRAGLWWPGKGHDRDSARHALAYMKLRRHLPTIERYWPRQEGVE